VDTCSRPETPERRATRIKSSTPAGPADYRRDDSRWWVGRAGVEPRIWSIVLHREITRGVVRPVRGRTETWKMGCNGVASDSRMRDPGESKSGAPLARRTALPGTSCSRSKLAGRDLPVFHDPRLNLVASIETPDANTVTVNATTPTLRPTPSLAAIPFPKTAASTRAERRTRDTNKLTGLSLLG